MSLLLNKLDSCGGDQNKIMALVSTRISDGVLPRTLDYYLEAGQPNIERLKCTVGELQSAWGI